MKQNTTDTLRELETLARDLRTLKAARKALADAKRNRANGGSAEAWTGAEATLRPLIERAAFRCLEACAALSQGGLESIPETAAEIAAR